MTDKEEQRAYLDRLFSDENREQLVSLYGEVSAASHLAELRADEILQIRAFRKFKARTIEQAALEKYDDPEPWNWRRVTQKENGSYEQEQVVPPPYGTAYEYVFVDTIINGLGGRIYDYLTATFVGDKCDRKYLESLLDMMTTMGYFNDDIAIEHYSGIDGGVAQWEAGPGERIISVERDGRPVSRLIIGRAKNMARADIVRRWIADKAELDRTQANVRVATSKRVMQKARVQYITVEALKSMLASLGLDRDSKPGEWAAAVRALHVKECLIAENPYRAVEWLESVGLTVASRKTLDNRWEYEEASQFANRVERRMFTAVLQEVSKHIADAKQRHS